MLLYSSNRNSTMSELLEQKRMAAPLSAIIIITGKPMRWLSDDDLARALVPFDVEMDLLHLGKLRLDVSLAFNHIVVPLDTGVRYKELYLGYEGVQVDIHARGGKVVEHRKHETITIAYTNTTTHHRTSEISLAPKLSYKSQGGELTAEPGGSTFQAGTTSAFTTSLHCEERILSPTLFDRKVRWLFNRPKVPSAVRDFLDGNLHLFAICAWTLGTPKTGTIRVKPSGISFFDENRSRLKSRWKGLVMEFLLRSRSSLYPIDRRGQQLCFEVQEPETPTR